MSTYRYADENESRVIGPEGVVFPADPEDPCQNAESRPRFPVDPSDPSKGFETVETEAYQRSQAFQRWLAEGNMPAPYEEPEAERESRERTRIMQRLAEIDIDSIRSIRAREAGTASDFDLAKLNELEAEAVRLRRELADLNQSTGE